MKNFIVYALIDPRNDLPFYIGKGQKIDKLGRKFRRFSEHLSCKDPKNPLKNNVIKKILSSGFEIVYEILSAHESESEAFDEEKRWISFFGRRDKNTGILTNLTDGGEGFCGVVVKEETKIKISNARKKYHETNPPSFLGMKHSEETRKFLSEYQKKRFENSPGTFLGKNHSDKSKNKMSKFRSENGTTLPKEEWHRYAVKPENNYFSKQYLFTNPNGKEFKVNGRFKAFVKEHNLSQATLEKFLNKGKVPEPKNPNHNRMSQQRINTSGWQVDLI